VPNDDGFRYSFVEREDHTHDGTIPHQTPVHFGEAVEV